MDIESLSNIKCDHEECTDLVKEFSKKYKKEHYHMLGPSVANSINRYISVICYSSYYLNGFCLMCDEINPIKLTIYLESINEYKVDGDILLIYVSYQLKKRINEFYKELKKGIYSVGVVHLKNTKDKSEYIKKCDDRVNSGLKLIRL